MDPVEITRMDAWIARKIGATASNPARDEIEAYQLRKMDETLRYARSKSPFYRTRLSRDGDTELSSVADLARLPFTTAADLRCNGLQLLCVSQGEIERVVTLQTSGTTSEPKRLYFTRDDQELTLDFFQVGMSTFVGAGERAMILLPGERPGSVGDLLAAALRRMNVEPIPHGPVKDVSRALDILVQDRIDSLVGMPAQLLWLARAGEAIGKVPPRVRSVLLTADYVPPAILREIQRIWGCEPFEHYGMTEMGLGGGVECHAHEGYHVREADLYLEIVDPGNGRQLPDGESGEVVVTTLTRRGMPLIRYRTGDISRFIPGPCPCGTSLKRLERVRGRLDDGVRLGDGNLLSMADLSDALFPMRGLLGFTAAVTGGLEGDALRIEATCVEGVDSEVTAGVRAALKTIPPVAAAASAGRVELSVAVRSSDLSSIPDQGKMRIMDRRNQDSDPPRLASRTGSAGRVGA